MEWAVPNDGSFQGPVAKPGGGDERAWEAPPGLSSPRGALRVTAQGGGRLIGPQWLAAGVQQTKGPRGTLGLPAAPPLWKAPPRGGRSPPPTRSPAGRTGNPARAPGGRVDSRCLLEHLRPRRRHARGDLTGGARAFTLLASLIDTCRQGRGSPWRFIGAVLRQRRQGAPAPMFPQRHLLPSGRTRALPRWDTGRLPSTCG